MACVSGLGGAFSKMAGRIHKARVFEGHKCTTGIHNALFDTIMPQVSGNAWKLLCLIIRQTDGWNREEIGLSYRDLLLGLGVSSRATVAAAIDELRPFNLLTINESGKWEETRYSLNLDVEIEWQPVDFQDAPVTENGTGSVTKNVTRITAKPVTENGTAPVTETVLFNRKESISETRESEKQINPLTHPLGSALLEGAGFNDLQRETLSSQNHFKLQGAINRLVKAQISPAHVRQAAQGWWGKNPPSFDQLADEALKASNGTQQKQAPQQPRRFVC